MSRGPAWQRPSRDLANAAPEFALRVNQLNALLAQVGAQHAGAALASGLNIEDMVITHAIARQRAPIEVFVIDTGRLHAETLALIDEARATFGIPIEVLHPRPEAVAQWVAAHGEDGFHDSVELRCACCALRKVEPLDRALAGRMAWLSGQRRAHGKPREALPVRELDTLRGIVKYNPLAFWPDEAVWHYADLFELPVNRLYVRGYRSIGCAPCTHPVRADQAPRAGRWWWEHGATKESGLHRAAQPQAHSRGRAH